MLFVKEGRDTINASKIHQNPNFDSNNVMFCWSLHIGEQNDCYV